jgi:hypothetical protein
MKTPPFLLLAALSFWGWQSGELIVGISAGMILELFHFFPMRWELAEEDFRRVEQLCVLLGLALVVYTFSVGDTTGNLRAGGATVDSAAMLLRWFPILWAPLVLAQNVSERGMMQLSTLLMFRRFQPLAGKRMVNVSYLYFTFCLFSAGMHPNPETHTYFWGFCVLLAWALWPVRSRRFGVVVWLVAMALAIGLGRVSTHGIGLMNAYIEGYSGQWIVKLLSPKTNPDESRTSIGQIGRLKLSGRIVIRLEPKDGSVTPAYLREASYMHYRAQVWWTDTMTNDFQTVKEDQTNEDNYTLVPRATNTGAVTISSYLNGWSKLLGSPEGLLPLPSGAHQLHRLPVAALATNNYGAVQADGPGLLIFDAQFGPGKTLDSAATESTNSFLVPANETNALNQVIEEIHAADLSDEQKLLAVQDFFSRKFTYSAWQSADKIPHGTNETSVSRFLLFSRSGHCEYFATATVLLLRQLHIPARYAVGYAVHERHGKKYVVRERDAHAWCLVWDRSKQVWEDFDTTPGSWVATEEDRASAFQGVSDFFSWLKFQFAKFRWGQASWRQYALWLLIPMMGFLLYKIVFRRNRNRGKGKGADGKKLLADWPGLDSDFYRLESRLAARGVPRHTGETLSNWLNRALEDPALKDFRNALTGLLQLHYRYRFDPAGLDAVGREELRRRTTECLAVLSPSGQKK